MVAIAMGGVGGVRRGRMRKIRLVAVAGLMAAVLPAPGVPSVFLPVSRHMPMRVRARQPCNEQGYTDQQGNSRGCLAQTEHHPG